MAGYLPSVSLVSCSHMHTRVCRLGFSQESEDVIVRYPGNLRLIREISVNGVRMSLLLRVQRCSLPNEGSLTGNMPQALEARWSHASRIHGQIFSLGRFVTVLLQLTGCSVIHWRPFNLTSPRIWTRCPPKLACLPSRESRAAYLLDQIKSQSMHYGWKLAVWVLTVYMWCLTAEKNWTKVEDNAPHPTQLSLMTAQPPFVSAAGVY